MIAVTPCERRALKKFQFYVKKYTNTHGSPLAIRIHHSEKHHTTTLGEEVCIPNSDVSHLMSIPLIRAITRSIEDIAAENGKGELIASFQHFSNFLPVKQRYCELSEKLDTVRVWGDGDVPKGCRHIDFVTAAHPKVSRYWMILFDSPHCRAVLLCKQLNKAEKFEDKKFVGFYSFNPYVVQSIRWRFNLVSCGCCKVITLFEKSFSIPEVPMREVQAYLKRAPLPVAASSL